MASLFSRAKGSLLLASYGLAVTTLRALPEDLTMPFQQRIAVKGPNAISIGWNTYMHLGQPCVHYGTSADNLDLHQCSNDSVTYPPSRTHANTVILSGLEPNTIYFYKIESTNSTLQHFLSPRQQGDKSPFSVKIVGDLGVYGVDGFTVGGVATNVNMHKSDTIPHVESTFNQTTIGQLASTIDDYELVVHPGGLAYADDWIYSPKILETLHAALPENVPLSESLGALYAGLPENLTLSKILETLNWVLPGDIPLSEILEKLDWVLHENVSLSEILQTLHAVLPESVSLSESLQSLYVVLHENVSFSEISKTLYWVLHKIVSFTEILKVLEGHPEAFETILENFYDQLAPIASRKPYMVGPGNHEARCLQDPYIGESFCPLGQTNFTDFMTRFGPIMPTAFESKSDVDLSRSKADRARMLARPPFWYSFEYGMVHFVMIDTETDFESAPDQPGGFAGLNSGPYGFQNQQLAFLEADLASVDRKVTPWVVVSGHRPWYTALASGDTPCLPCQAAFEPLLYRYGVDLAIFAHVHNSQRFNPVVNGTADPKGLQDPKAPVYIVAGGAGSIEGLDHIVHKPANTAWAYDEDFSYARLSFLDEKQLKITFHRSTNGELLDQSVLYKSHNERFVNQSYPALLP